MTPRDFAKPAQVILDRGMWNGERFLSASYVNTRSRADPGRQSFIWTVPSPERR